MRGLHLFSLACCACAAVGCGTAPQTSPISSEDAGVSVVISPAYEASPVFVRALVIPQEISPQDAAAIAVEARDPLERDSDITYSWTAPSGSFSRPNEAVTAYRCGETGDQILSVIAADGRGGVSELALAVKCTR